MTLIEIKTFMKKNKITYAELAERSGIPEGTLKHIFAKAETANPQLFTLQAIERALGLTPTADDIVQSIKITPLARRLLDAFDKLDEEDQRKVVGIVEAFAVMS